VALIVKVRRIDGHLAPDAVVPVANDFPARVCLVSLFVVVVIEDRLLLFCFLPLQHLDLPAQLHCVDYNSERAVLNSRVVADRA